MSTPMSAIPGGPQAPSQGAGDLSGLLGNTGTTPDKQADSASDPSMAFMQLAKQLDDQIDAMTRAYPDFSKAGDAMKKALQEGGAAVVGKMRNSSGGGIDYMG